jgi:gluconolactonase
MIFAEGFTAPEGPVALPDGTWLIVEAGANRGCVTHVSADGKTASIVAKTGRPNGLAIDAEEFVWVAESKVPSLIRLSMDGKAEVVATACGNERFLFPNDLCFGPDGALYMTDSGIQIENFAPDNKIPENYADLHYDGRIYRVNVETGSVEKIDEGLKFTNGIAVGPDGRLYVNESVTGNVYRYSQDTGGTYQTRELFGNVWRENASGWNGPDGMAFGMDGRLYVAVFGQRDVTVFGTNGAVVERISTTGAMPSNIAFALPGRKSIYVTEFEFGQIEVFGVATDGLPLWLGPKASRRSASG